MHGQQGQPQAAGNAAGTRKRQRAAARTAAATRACTFAASAAMSEAFSQGLTSGQLLSALRVSSRKSEASLTAAGRAAASSARAKMASPTSRSLRSWDLQRPGRRGGREGQREAGFGSWGTGWQAHTLGVCDLGAGAHCFRVACKLRGMHALSHSSLPPNLKLLPTHLYSAVSTASPSPYSQSSISVSCARKASRCSSVVTPATSSPLSTCRWAR